MDIDIQYLLFLQELHNATGGIIDEFFNVISKIAVEIMPLLPYLVFWAIDKNWGYRFLGTQWFGELINGTIKLSVCAYRPWIRDARIEPAGDSKVAATGYSFPSGHTLCATAEYGTTAVWQRNKRKWLAVLCCVMILLTGFSRNFLGVHTPQDVLVGFLETVCIICAAGFVQKKTANDPHLADILTIASVIVALAVLVYINVKPYPMDYVDGVLLVDPQKMMKDTFSGVGGVIGLMAGSYIERHYIKYKIPEGAKSLPVMTCVGTAVIFVWNQYLSGITVKLWFGANWGYFISAFLTMLFVVVLYPICIMKSAEK